MTAEAALLLYKSRDASEKLFCSEKKVIADSSAKKWHILVIAFLVAIVAYVAYFAICHRILMIGFIATLFMLFFEGFSLKSGKGWLSLDELKVLVGECLDLFYDDGSK